MTITSARTAFILLVMVSFVWGAEYVLVDRAIEVVSTTAFNAARFGVAALSLLPLLWFSKEKVLSGQHRTTISYGLFLGFLLFVGFYTQTEGLLYTSVSNAGFINGLAVPLVPLLSFIFLGIKRPAMVWGGVACATTGLYLLIVDDNLVFNKGDLLVLVSAFGFTIHIIVTGQIIAKLPVIWLSIIQLSAVSIYNMAVILVSSEPLIIGHSSELPNVYQLISSPIIVAAVLVAGVLGSGFAVWVQASSQRLLQSHQVALIFASEPVFAYLCAWLFLGETLGRQAILGAGFIIAGMLISELGDRGRTAELKPLDHTATIQ